MQPWICVDWETPYGKDFSVVDLGYWKYARDERCVPYLISVCDGTESWAGEVKDFNFESLRGRRLLSHNKPFDEEIALAGNERGLFDFPGLKTHGNNHWLCTLDMSAYLWNVRSLADACRIGLGITVDKSVRDRAKDKTVDDMKREGWWPDMLKYGGLDATRGWTLFDKHGDKWPEFERRLSCLTVDQGRHGVRIDVRALDEGILTMQRVIAAAELNLPWVKRGRAPASPIGLAEECRNVGIPMAPVKTHDPEGAQQWEDTYSTKHKFVFALKNLRKAKKTLATLETIKLRLRPDETVAFSLKYAGAHTLRWAGDSGWNLQNQNKEPLFIDADYSFIFDKAAREANVKEFDKHHVGHSSFGKLESKTTFFDLRGLIIAREGMMLCPVDESQIEPRVLNWLAGNWGLLEKIRTGLAIYEAHARETMPEANEYATPLKDTSKKLYALAKARVLGLGYGCGWEKFIVVAQMMAGIDITEGDMDFALAAAVDGKVYRRRKALNGRDWDYETYTVFDRGADSWAFGKLSEQETNTNPWEDVVFVVQRRKRKNEIQEFIGPLGVYGMRSRVTVEEFRKSNPLVTALWKALDDELRKCGDEGRDLVVTGPHGASLTYRNVRAEKRKVVDKETGDEYEKRVYTAEIGGKRCVLYGGLLCENCLAGETEVLTEKRGWVRLDSVTQNDRVWDGVEWVSHEGLVARGEQEVVTLAGVELTSDHRVLTMSGWRAAGETVAEELFDPSLAPYPLGHHRRLRLTGRDFGRLHVLEDVGNRSSQKGSWWRCKCTCGQIVVRCGKELTKGSTSSCGCYQKEGASARARTHGMTGHPAYAVWRSMLDRCRRPTHRAYPNYGGRGISVCAAWDTFEGFWRDMGPSYVSGLTLDRENNEGNYEPPNCRWVTQKVQCNNKRNNVVLDTAWGRITQAEAARHSGLRPNVLAWRLARGWSTEAAISSNRTPRNLRHLGLNHS